MYVPPDFISLNYVAYLHKLDDSNVAHVTGWKMTGS